MFEKTKAKLDQQINDRVTAPVKSAVILSAFALVIAVVALFVAASKG